MNVLFLTSSLENYQADIVFHGFVDLLGADHVHEWPPKDLYHREPGTDKFAAFDFRHPAPPPDAKKLLVEGYYDLVVVDFRADFALLRGAVGLTRRGIIVLDGEETDFVSPDHYKLCELYAKRDLPIGWTGPSRVVPCPMAWVPQPMTVLFSPERPVDVSYVVCDTFPTRRALYDQLAAVELGKKQVRIAPHPNSPLTYDEHRKLLSESKISFSVRGAGLDVYRYWEIPAHGACQIAVGERPVIPDDFADGVEIVRATTYREGAVAAQTLLKDPARLEEIAEKGHEALQKRHRSRHRAEFLLNRLENM